MNYEQIPCLGKDLKAVVEKCSVKRELAESTVFVTGATGLVGSLLIKSLLTMNVSAHTGIHIIGLARSEAKVVDVFGSSELPDVSFVYQDITEPLLVESKVDYIFHCASITTSKLMIERPVDTIRVALEGTRNVLELAREKSVQSMVYVSSMEVYGSFFDGRNVTEKDYGWIDPLKVRSNYSEGKRMCENMCIAYAHQFDLPVKIARLAQTFGAGVLRGENRVFAQFARSAMHGADIVLHTKGLSEGNYCYTADVMLALLLLLVRGCDGEAYNVANEACHTSIAAMAEMVAREFSEKSRVIFDIPKENTFGYAPDTRMTLDASKLRKLGWTPTVDLKEAYARLIEYLRYMEQTDAAEA